jgi:D-alanyl-D-alanine carboxypeptidase
MKPESYMRVKWALATLTFSLAVFNASFADSGGVNDPLNARIRRSFAPGAEVLLIDNGVVALDRCYGVRDKQSSLAVDQHTRFEIGSVSKQFTAAAILQLKEAGRLSLTDPLGKFVPEYRPGQSVTIEQLLWQISGIPDFTSQPAYWEGLAVKNGRLTFTKTTDPLGLIENMPLRFKPGTKWEYSNSNYELLGEVVERASGMRYQQYIRSHVFARAGMTESSFTSEELRLPNMATGYGIVRSENGEILFTNPPHLTPAAPIPDPSGGAGSIVSTAHDLAKWDEALLAGRIIDAGDLARMTSPGPRDAEKNAVPYGFGWQIMAYDDAPRLSHNGSTLGFSSSNQVYPSLKQYIIVLTNFAFANADSIGEVAFDQHNPKLAALQNAPASGERAEVTFSVKRLWQQMTRGHIDRSELENRFNAFMTDARMEQTKSEFSTLPAPTAWVYRGLQQTPRGIQYHYRLRFTYGRVVDLFVTYNAAGKVAALGFLGP